MSMSASSRESADGQKKIVMRRDDDRT